MENKVIFESEEFNKFLNDCVKIEDQEDVRFLAKQKGYIRKSKVDEAEEMYEKWKHDCTSSGLSEIIIKLHEAIQYLKSKPEEKNGK
jgi:hypothetical protein